MKATEIEVHDGFGLAANVVKIIHRKKVKARGWEWARYKYGRYQVFGGIRTPEYINLDHPIRRRK